MWRCGGWRCGGVEVRRYRDVEMVRMNRCGTKRLQVLKLKLKNCSI